MGRPTTSTESKKANGTFRQSVHGDRMDIEVKPCTNVPEPPIEFDADHRAKWYDVATKIVDMNIYHEADFDMLKRYVVTMIIWERAAADIAKNGVLVMGKTRPIQNPSFNAMMITEKQLQMFADKFGLSPKSRMGVRVNAKVSSDPIADFLKELNQ